MPASIWCMVGFIFLFLMLNVPFTLDLFHFFFVIQVMKTNRFISFGAGANWKLIEEIPGKFRKL